MGASLSDESENDHQRKLAVASGMRACARTLLPVAPSLGTQPVCQRVARPSGAVQSGWPSHPDLLQPAASCRAAVYHSPCCGLHLSASSPSILPAAACCSPSIWLSAFETTPLALPAAACCCLLQPINLVFSHHQLSHIPLSCLLLLAVANSALEGHCCAHAPAPCACKPNRPTDLLTLPATACCSQQRIGGHRPGVP